MSLHDKSVFFMFLGDELFQIFTFCYYGEHIMEKSTEVGNSLYNSSWIRTAQYVKPVFVMLKLGCQSPLSTYIGWRFHDTGLRDLWRRSTHSIFLPELVTGH